MDKDIDNLLENWHDAKQTIAELENKCERYKRLADKLMRSQDTTKLSSHSFQLNKRTISRTTLTKKDVPKDIWDRYSREITYTSYYLKERK